MSYNIDDRVASQVQVNGHPTWDTFNHGKFWNPELLSQVKGDFLAGHTVIQIAKKQGRALGSIIPKLVDLQLVQFDPSSNSYHSLVNTFGQPIKQEEPEMTKTIETVVMINGADASKLSDGQIFDLIGSIEGQIDRLSKIKAQPKKLVARIKELQDDIQKLVEYVDNRETTH